MASRFICRRSRRPGRGVHPAEAAGRHSDDRTQSRGAAPTGRGVRSGGCESRARTHSARIAETRCPDVGDPVRPPTTPPGAGDRPGAVSRPGVPHPADGFGRGAVELALAGVGGDPPTPATFVVRPRCERARKCPLGRRTTGAPGRPRRDRRSLQRGRDPGRRLAVASGPHSDDDHTGGPLGARDRVMLSVGPHAPTAVAAAEKIRSAAGTRVAAERGRDPPVDPAVGHLDGGASTAAPPVCRTTSGHRRERGGQRRARRRAGTTRSRWGWRRSGATRPSARRLRRRCSDPAPPAPRGRRARCPVIEQRRVGLVRLDHGPPVIDELPRCRAQLRAVHRAVAVPARHALISVSNMISNEPAVRYNTRMPRRVRAGHPSGGDRATSRDEWIEPITGRPSDRSASGDRPVGGGRTATPIDDRPVVEYASSTNGDRS